MRRLRVALDLPRCLTASIYYMTLFIFQGHTAIVKPHFYGPLLLSYVLYHYLIQ